MKRASTLVSRLVALFFATVAAGSHGAVYQVGPGLALSNLQAIATIVRPGDTVEVAGNARYPGDVRLNVSGAAGASIVIKGRRVNGKRPVIAGVGSEEAAVLRVTGDFYEIEGLELTGAGNPLATRGIRNVGHGTVIRDTVVHSIMGHGILNSDAAGSLSLSRVEVYGCGKGEPFHQVYIGMDNAKYPTASFRMEFCHLHDGTGGNNLKSRAGRNEIYYNWLQGAFYCELDLIGPDRHGKPMNKTNELRADSDVVGNVIYKSSSSPVTTIRVGGDGSGASHGRYRFVNNTIVLSPQIPTGIPVFKLQDDLESLEVYNCVFYRFGQPMRMTYNPGLKFRTTGLNNWIPKGATLVPKEWKNTIWGTAEPGFIDPNTLNFKPTTQSPLNQSGIRPIPVFTDAEFPNPLPWAEYVPHRLSDTNPVKTNEVHHLTTPPNIGAL